MLCKQFLVAGRVQGVWYRAATRERAEALSLGGYVRNLADGRVEVVACGAEERLAELADWLWQGPARARVSAVEAQDLEWRQTASFDVR